MLFNSYMINDKVIFNVNKSEFQSLTDNGVTVTLNAPTARCLQLLLDSSGKVISREKFLDEVWNARGVVVSENTFYQNISLLRKSLIRAGLNNEIIITVRRRGFVISEGTVIKMLPPDEKASSGDQILHKRIIQDVNKSQLLAIQTGLPKKKMEGYSYNISKLSVKLSFLTLVLMGFMTVANIIICFI